MTMRYYEQFGTWMIRECERHERHERHAKSHTFQKRTVLSSLPLSGRPLGEGTAETHTGCIESVESLRWVMSHRALHLEFGCLSTSFDIFRYVSMSRNQLLQTRIIREEQQKLDFISRWVQIWSLSLRLSEALWGSLRHVLVQKV